jgi:hypothetical protein
MVGLAERDYVKSDVLEDLLQFRDQLRDHMVTLTPKSFHRDLLGVLDHHLSDTIEEISG